MKTREEIYDKIREYDEMAKAATNEERKERLYIIIDALVWVVGDNSGAPI